MNLMARSAAWNSVEGAASEPWIEQHISLQRANIRPNAIPKVSIALEAVLLIEEAIAGNRE
jgi:hypothetical protein